jgi:hypothetical protein
MAIRDPIFQMPHWARPAGRSTNAAKTVLDNADAFCNTENRFLIKDAKMPELEWIRKALYDRRLSVVSSVTGISEPTLRAIRNGVWPDGKEINPKLKTLQALEMYFRGDGE